MSSLLRLITKKHRSSVLLPLCEVNLTVTGPSQRASKAVCIFYGIHWNFPSTNCILSTIPPMGINTLRPRQNGRRFTADTFKRIFSDESVRISIKILLKFVPKGPINNNPALVQIMAWCRSGDKPLSEPMMVSLLTHLCVTRPQWVKFCWEDEKVPPTHCHACFFVDQNI